MNFDLALPAASVEASGNRLEPNEKEGRVQKRSRGRKVVTIE